MILNKKKRASKDFDPYEPYLKTSNDDASFIFSFDKKLSAEVAELEKTLVEKRNKNPVTMISTFKG